MELAVGEIISGKVTGITKFGAFVSLPEGKSGLVHISEVDQSYVSDIRDHLTEGQEVKVKVIAIDDNGRVNLSIKRTQPRQNSNGEQRSFRRSNQNGTHSNGQRATAAISAAPAAPTAAKSSSSASRADMHRVRQRRKLRLRLRISSSSLCRTARAAWRICAAIRIRRTVPAAVNN